MEFTAYADESGYEGDSVYCVTAGFIGTLAAWRSFDDAWRPLIPSGAGEFKSSQFFARRSAHGSKTNPYVDWDDDKALDFAGPTQRA